MGMFDNLTARLKRNQQDDPAAQADAELAQELNGNPAKEEADRGLPSVNATKAGNKMVNKIIFICVAIFGLYVIYQVNSGPDKRAKAEAERKAKEAESNAISGNLPAIGAPPPPPPPQFAVPGPNGAVAGDAPPPPPIPVQKATGPGGKPVKTPYELAMERRQRGSVLAPIKGDASGAEGENGPASASRAGVPGSQFEPIDGSPLGQALMPTVAKGTAAKRTIDRNYLLAKGGFLDCALETRLDSTVPGMTSCILTRTIYSDNGKVVLLERGSKVTGQYQGGIKHGQARIFVLWNRIQTPNGVVIDLNSPGTDALGASGLDGYVDSHFWERFGGAILMSLIDDVAAVVSRGSNNSSEGNTQINLGGTSQAASNVSTEVIKQTINIPPTLKKNHGDHINIYVARDLDFRSVYDLAPQ